ncbi:hypothetical protein HELRODRAFT_85837, partial [Helobdella robusta]|uniref:Fork-head domain-containing protein n=1 Tax=Helobdella robusta TaxID=6412 RepID=T1G632_HELRO
YQATILFLMGKERSPNKQLLVKKIYKWVETNIPFYNQTRKGWKNSVRLNL